MWQTVAICVWNARDCSSVTQRLQTEEDMVTEQPLTSTDEGKNKMDLGAGTNQNNFV